MVDRDINFWKPKWSIFKYHPKREKMSSIKGLELAFKYYSSGGLNSREEAFVVAFHTILVVFDFKCLGLAPENETNVGHTYERGSELLPQNWNENTDVFSLKYVFSPERKVCIIKIIKSGSELYINALRVSGEKIISMTVETESFVTDKLTDFEKLYVDVEMLRTRIHAELVEQLFPTQKVEAGPAARNILAEESRNIPRRPIRDAYDIHGVHDPVRNVGRADLDPFGQGGGMLLDNRDLIRQPRPGVGLPRGAVPPGARFNPIFPRGIGRGAGPDPDHLPPPGYDDMFG